MLEALFGAIAEAVIGYWLSESGIADKIRRLISRDDAHTLAFKMALGRAFTAFEVQHPDMAHLLFDKHFLEHGAVPILARCLQRDNPPNPVELATAWAIQLNTSHPEGLADRYVIEATNFLQYLQAELRLRPEFQPFFDSRTLDSIAQSSSQAATTLVNLEQEIIRLREVAQSQHITSINVVLPVELDVVSPKQPGIFFQTVSNVPPPVSDFVGRKTEVDQLVNALRKHTQKENAVSISGIRGLGGLGKTQLAYVVAHQLTPYFPDGQLLINLQGAGENWLRPEQAIRIILTSLAPGINLTDVSDPEQLQSIYRSLLTGRRVLILADNARDAKQIEPLLPPQGCALLITSRQRFLLPGMRAIDLGTLSSLEAQKLLQDICPRIGSAAPRLAKLCGYLPLALRISAELLQNEPNIGIDSFLKELEINKLHALHNPDHPDDPDKSVWASFNLSYRVLPTAAQVALCQLSIIPASFDQDTAVEVIDVLNQADEQTYSSSKETGHLVRLLHRRNLLEWKSVSKRYDFHDLVRSFAQEHLDHEMERATRLRLASYYSQTASGVDYTFVEGSEPIHSGLGLFNPVMLSVKVTSSDSTTSYSEPQEAIQEDIAAFYSQAKERHANYIINFAVNHSHDWKAIEIEWENAQAAWDWISKESRNLNMMLNAIQALYPFQERRGLWREAIAWGQQTLQSLQKVDDKYNECVVLNNLGVMYTNLGEMKAALELFNQALSVAQTINDVQSESYVLGNLGLVNVYLGRTHEAVTSFEAQLAIAQNIGDRHSEGMALNNLGSVYLDFGKFERAMTFYKEAITITREINNQRAEGMVLANQGSLYLSKGDTHQALDCYQKALEIAQQTGDVRSQANIQNNLANAYANQRQNELAVEHYKNALIVAREIDDKRGQISILNNLAQVYANQGNIDHSAEWYEYALDISRAVGGRLSEGNVLNNLGNAYAGRGELLRAIDAYQEALVIVRDIGDQENESRILGNLCLVHIDLGNLDQAASICQQHLIKVQTINDRHGEGVANRNWGHIYLKSGRLYKAVESYRRQLAVGRVMGNQRNEGNALSNLGNCYANLGQVSDAIDNYYKPSLVIAREASNLIDECIVLGNLGNAYARLDEVQHSIDYYHQALKLADEVGNRRIKAIIAWNFGQVYEAMGQYEQAVNLMQTTVEYERDIKHPNAEKDFLRLETLRNKIIGK